MENSGDDQPRRHHTIISGTGRAGTTFLVKLLTNLGLDTGFRPDLMPTYANCNAGLEADLFAPGAPYIVKNPYLCEQIDEVLTRPEIVIDHAIIPMRSLEAAAESRRFVNRTSDRSLYPEDVDVPGGLWGTADPARQEEILARRLHNLMVGLARSGARVILVHYPRLTRDPAYLFGKLGPILGPSIDLDRFTEVFHRTVEPELVHRFATDDN